MTQTPSIIAHRGASAAAPENTVEAYRLAKTLGADAVELDVRRAGDGRLLVSHDPLPGIIAPDVATLSAALDACAGMWVNVEIKNDPDDPDFDASESIADDTVATLIERGDDRNWLISSFRMETIDRCRALAPQIATAWLTVDVPDGVVQTLAGKGHRALHPWYGCVTEGLVAEAHEAGVEINVWTCDEPQWIVRLAGWGIDGICTNVPDLALRALGR